MTAPQPARSPDCPTDRPRCEGPGTYRCDEDLWGSQCRGWQARNGGYHAPGEVERAAPTPAELLAQRFHDAYERLAPSFGYSTREASAKPWSQVPVRNRRLMIATAHELLSSGYYAALSEEIRADLIEGATRGLSLAEPEADDGSAPALPNAPEDRCPECGDDPEDPTLHRQGCPRIGLPEQFQCGPPWQPLPEPPLHAEARRGTNLPPSPE